MKTQHIYSVEEAAHSVELFVFMQENGLSVVYDLFQSDPDILRIAGSEVSFTEVDINENTAFIIYSDSEYQATESKIKGMLQRFYGNNFRDYFTQLDSIWKVFLSLVNGIAYRGGQGYHYTKSRAYIFENLVSRFKRKAPDHNREPFQNC